VAKEQSERDAPDSQIGVPPGLPTLAMSASRQWLFWVILLGISVGLLYALRGVLLPFVAGIAIAYLIDPIADKLVKWGVGRAWATLGIILVGLLGFFAVLALLIPLLQVQAISLVQFILDSSDDVSEWIGRAMSALQDRISPDDMARLREGLGDAVSSVAAGLQYIVGGVISGGFAILNILSLIFVTPIVAFYLIRDWDNLVGRVDDLLPRDHAPVIRDLVKRIDTKLAGFIRGQTMVAAIQGVFYATALTIAGLDFGLVIGLGAGFASFFPYVGSIGGLIVSVGMAVVQFGEIVPVLIVAAIFIAGQIIEGNFLTPKLVGDQVGLHPVWLIFALLAGGALLGILGLLLAVPIAAVISVLAEYAGMRYRSSAIYGGDATPPIRSSAQPED
jgi:predicted PurR-regulated permease PerM